MIGRRGLPHDPFEGEGARRTHLRVRLEGVAALALAIVACGLVTAAWLQILAPLLERLGLT